MRLSAPTKPVFWISVILVVLSLLAQFDVVNIGFHYWLAIIGYVLLFAGNTMKGV